jgi:hypothetical protein
MSFRVLLSCVVVATLVFLTSSRSKADEIFTFQVGVTYTWELPASPTIPPNDAAPLSFVIPNVTYSVNGAVSTFFPDQFDFFTAGDGGGFALLNTLDPSFPLHVAIDEFGPQLFAGSTSAPTFLPGTYTLTSAKNGTGTLVIASTPEPGSLLLIGSGLLAFLGFRRKNFRA